MAKIEAILLDMDGTLRDSREAIFTAIEKTLAEHGSGELDRSALLSHIHNLRSVHAQFTSGADYESFRDIYTNHVNTLHHTIAVYEHVPQTLKSLKAAGFMLGVVSSSRFAVEALANDELIEDFDAIIGGSDVINHKPHPEPILMALGKLGVEPARAVMVGDLPADVLAGKTAGVLATVGVTHGFGTGEMLEAAGADYLISTMNQLPELIDTINR